jgi:hypothetical protein
MGDLNLTEAFAKYGAKPVNRQWAFSAIEDGSLVLSCWQHKITTEKGVWRYSDCLSRLQSQTHGRNLLEKHLGQAHNEKLRVRIVIVATNEAGIAIVDAGEDASKIEKTFDVREDYIGQVVSFDGDAYVIEFKKQVASA